MDVDDEPTYSQAKDIKQVGKDTGQYDNILDFCVLIFPSISLHIFSSQNLLVSSNSQPGDSGERAC